MSSSHWDYRDLIISWLESPWETCPELFYDLYPKPLLNHRAISQCIFVWIGFLIWCACLCVGVSTGVWVGVCWDSCMVEARTWCLLSSSVITEAGSLAETSQSASLVSQLAAETPCLASENLDYTHVRSHARACVESVWATKPSPQPRKCGSLSVCLLSYKRSEVEH